MLQIDENDKIDCTLQLSNSNYNSSILLDTGALHGNYINEDVASILTKENKCKQTRRKIKGAFTSAEACSNLECDLCVKVINENTNEEQTMCFNAAVIDSNYEIIVGRNLIKERFPHSSCKQSDNIMIKGILAALL